MQPVTGYGIVFLVEYVYNVEMQMKYEKVPKQEKSSFFSYTTRRPVFEYTMHYHPEYELILITKGAGKVYISGEVTDYKPGDLLLLGPNLPHTFVSSELFQKQGSNQAIVTQFTKDFLGEIFWNSRELSRINQLLKHSDFGLLFNNPLPDDFQKKLADIYSRTGIDRLLLLLDILSELSKCVPCRKIIRSVPPGKTYGSPKLLSALNHIHKHFAGPLKITDTAKIVHMSDSGFAKFFKRHVGYSYNDYLIQVRLEHACSLLLNTRKKILDICYECGFNNLSNFNRQFLKNKKTSPSQYRKDCK